jgi:hypothetical protein
VNIYGQSRFNGYSIRYILAMFSSLLHRERATNIHISTVITGNRNFSGITTVMTFVAPFFMGIVYFAHAPPFYILIGF